MNLNLIFQKTNKNDDYARARVLLGVFNELDRDEKYQITHVNPKELNIPPFKGSSGSIDSVQNMTIVNPNNNKAIIFNIGPRLEQSFLSEHGFDHLNIVQVIGGSALSQEFYNACSEEIQIKIKTIRKPLVFPLDKISQENIALNYQINRKDKKIKKAIFIGNTESPVLPGRFKLMKILNKHPYFKVIHSMREGGYLFKDYLDEMNKYKLSLSLNGFAEICYRDWESMSIGIPIVRSELYSEYDERLIPSYHYISATEPTKNGMIDYHLPINDIADQYINEVEKIIDEDDVINQIGMNGREYFENNIVSTRIVRNFLKTVDLNLLK